MLHPEAVLFPSIFSYDTGHNPMPIGTIPGAFLSQEKNSRMHRIASLTNHAKNHLQLAGIATATDFRYSTWLFDGMLNSSLS